MTSSSPATRSSSNNNPQRKTRSSMQTPIKAQNPQVPEAAKEIMVYRMMWVVILINIILLFNSNC